MSSQAKHTLLVVLLLSAAAALILWQISKSSGDSRSADATQDAGKRAGSVSTIDRGFAEEDDPSEPGDIKEEVPFSSEDVVNEEVLETLLEITQRFAAASNAGGRFQLYQDLQSLVRRNEGNGAAGAIASFIRSGADAETGLPFQVGTDGVLDTAPTVRVALLDLAMQVDPFVGLDLGREVMDARTSPDEYAIGMRNLAWSDLEGDLRPEMETRFSEMLDESRWLAEPTAGFLEAFDVAVELATSKAFEDVVSVTRLEYSNGEAINKGIEKASFIAMDRIMVKNPSVVVDSYLKNPSLLDFAPDHRASLMSRLDLTTDSGKEAFAKYLNEGNHGAGELDYFASLYPNGNYFYGNRLVSSQEITPSIVQLQEHDKAALSVISEMIQSGQLRGEAAETIRKRLATFVSEINNAGSEEPSLRLE